MWDSEGHRPVTKASSDVVHLYFLWSDCCVRAVMRLITVLPPAGNYLSLCSTLIHCHWFIPCVWPQSQPLSLFQCTGQRGLCLAGGWPCCPQPPCRAVSCHSPPGSTLRKHQPVGCAAGGGTAGSRVSPAPLWLAHSWLLPLWNASATGKLAGS